MSNDIELKRSLLTVIIKSLQPHESMKHMYVARWKWQGTEEVYTFGYRDLIYLVDDIVSHHPKCWDYRNALIALEETEKGIVDPITHTYGGTKAWYIDIDAYYDVRDKMLDLTTEPNRDVFSLLSSLGPNPTQGLSSDKDESKRMANLLINKCWRTRKDYVSKISSSQVRDTMIKDLLKDPLLAMQTNSYIYAAIKQHRIDDLLC